MSVEFALLYLALGAFTGFFAGLLGVGGGSIMVPVLVMFLAWQGFAPDMVMRLALGTSMAAILFTSSSSARSHVRHNAVLWPIVMRITPGILFGTMLGTWIVKLMPTWWVALIFTAFILYVAIQMILGLRPRPGGTMPGLLGTTCVGVGIGAFSCLVAIGGGVLSVPFMVWCNVRIQHAIGTSSAIAFPIALGGAVGYAINGYSVADLPPYSLGFIYLPAVVLLAATSILTAPLGVSLAHRLPVIRLRQIFAAVLLLLAGKMVWTLFVSA
ncbi:MAG: sulfite exporter TauE/SafE family protein [Betaproteobacteria bacterium]|nr:sulfite exporter TauE/SafE family protein [Betaproteobacteria bacterium]